MYYQAINACSIDRCLAWKIRSNDRCIKEVRFLSISHSRIEKSDSIDCVGEHSGQTTNKCMQGVKSVGRFDVLSKVE